MEDFNVNISEVMATHKVLITQIILSVGAVLIYVIVAGIKNRLINRFAKPRNLSPSYVSTIKKSIGLLLLVTLAFIFSLVWGVDLEGLYVATTGIFAIIGIAFFAVWSILSNITSGIIIFFRFPFKVGDTIAFVEERDYKMRIVDMTLFHIDLVDENGNLITLPNNVAIQRVVVVHKG